MDKLWFKSVLIFNSKISINTYKILCIKDTNGIFINYCRKWFIVITWTYKSILNFYCTWSFCISKNTILYPEIIFCNCLSSFFINSNLSRINVIYYIKWCIVCAAAHIILWNNITFNPFINVNSACWESKTPIVKASNIIALCIIIVLDTVNIPP